MIKNIQEESLSTDADYYRPGEAARKLSISLSYLGRLTREGKISASAHTEGGQRRYSAEDIIAAERFLKGARIEEKEAKSETCNKNMQGVGQIINCIGDWKALQAELCSNLKIILGTLDADDDSIDNWRQWEDKESLFSFAGAFIGVASLLGAFFIMELARYTFDAGYDSGVSMLIGMLCYIVGVIATFKITAIHRRRDWIKARDYLWAFALSKEDDWQGFEEALHTLFNHRADLRNNMFLSALYHEMAEETYPDFRLCYDKNLLDQS